MSKLNTTISDAEFQRVARIYKALSNPHRLKIFKSLVENYSGGVHEETLEEDANCQREYAQEMGLAPSTLSNYFKELRDSGLVHSRRRGKYVVFWIDEENVKLVQHFLEK